MLGATSLVGQFLVQRLLYQGDDVVAISRHPHQAEAHITWIVADFEDAEPGLNANTSIAYSVSHIWLLPRVLPALSRSGIRRLIAFSSTSRFTKEASPVESERTIARRIAASELQVSAFCARSGIDWTILRPTVIYAEGKDRSITRLAELAARFHVLPLAGTGSGLRQPVHADDLAAGAIAAADSLQARNRAYDLPGGETISYREMCERIFRGLNLKPRIISVPSPLWRFGLTLARPLLPRTTTAMGSRMADDLTFDGEPAKRDFGWQPRPFNPRFPASADRSSVEATSGLG